MKTAKIIRSSVCSVNIQTVIEKEDRRHSSAVACGASPWWWHGAQPFEQGCRSEQTSPQTHCFFLISIFCLFFILFFLFLSRLKQFVSISLLLEMRYTTTLARLVLCTSSTQAANQRRGGPTTLPPNLRRNPTRTITSRRRRRRGQERSLAFALLALEASV